jgi:hypothetical protein
LDENKNTTIPITDPERLLGNKIPITELHLILHNAEGDIIYQDIKVIMGHNLTPARMDEEQKLMRAKASSIFKRDFPCPKDSHQLDSHQDLNTRT